MPFHTFTATILALLFPLLIIGIIGYWMYNMFNIRISIDETGINYESPWKKFLIQWQDVVKIEKKYFYSGYFDKFGKPKEFEITSRNRERLRIYIFLEKILDVPVSKKESFFEKIATGEHVGAGIDDFEQQLKQYGVLKLGEDKSKILT